MEAVPRLPMINFELKHTTESTSFGNLKLYIADCYEEDPETYSKEVYALESLRNAACRPSIDVTGCNTLKRYYCQLAALQCRFPLTSDRQLFTFSWRDIYSTGVTQATDIRYDMAVTLYNYGVLHGMLGAATDRTTADGMKTACTHFQCAAWAFGHLKDTFVQATSGDLSPEVLIFMQEISFAQAQECILEKSLADNRKPGIVSKVTAQIVTYYNAAFSALLNTGEDGSVSDIVGSKNFKEWKRYVKFKNCYLNAILCLYHGLQFEEEQKMGARVTLFQVAWDNLEEAKKESKGLNNIEAVNETLTFVTDVIEAKRKAAKNENEFIYHEEVPEFSTFSAVQGANLVKGIGFNVTDADAMGEDIFHRLVPIKAHEASSLYSEEKAKLLRHIGSKVDEKDTELNTFMGSLNVESLNIDNQSNRLPQSLVDRCAALNAKPTAISDLVSSMANLAETCSDVESMLAEIKELLNEEERLEQSYQKTTGARTTVNFAELQREYSKYQEAHNKAGESNETLRKAMGLHVANLKTLSQPLADLQGSVPTCSNADDNESIKELHSLLDKVNEMRMQRAVLLSNLRAAINNDDITSQLISCSDKKLDKFIKNELCKYDKYVTFIEQNLSAQANILRALTECYARCAAHIKTIMDTKHKRDHFFSSLASSYDVYDDLLSKSSKGLEFYKKLQTNIQKLLSRIRGARDVQDEERQQRLQSNKTGSTITNSQPATVSQPRTTGPKLKDYLKSGTLNRNLTNASAIDASDPATATFIPPVRPNPVGSEATTISSAPVSSTYNEHYYSQTAYPQPNEAPPPYSAYPPVNPNDPAPSYSESKDNMWNSPYIYNMQYTSTYSTKPMDSYSNSNTSTKMHMSSNPNQTFQTQMVQPQQQQQQQPQQQQPQQQQQPSQYNQNLTMQLMAPQQNPQQYSTPGFDSMNQQQQQQPQQQQQQQLYGPSAWDQQQSTLNDQMSRLSMHPTMTDPNTIPNPMYPSYGGAPNQYPDYNNQQQQMPTTTTTTMYTITSQPNYQFTANNQYVTGYDQSGTVQSQQQQQQLQQDDQLNQSYGSHPGYVYNSLTGEYQYRSGYQQGGTHMNNVYSQYTNVNIDQSSNTTESTNISTNGLSFANQYANASVIDQEKSTNPNALYNSTSVKFYEGLNQQEQFQPAVGFEQQPMPQQQQQQQQYFDSTSMGPYLNQQQQQQPQQFNYSDQSQQQYQYPNQYQQPQQQHQQPQQQEQQPPHLNPENTVFQYPTQQYQPAAGIPQQGNLQPQISQQPQIPQTSQTVPVVPQQIPQQPAQNTLTNHTNVSATTSTPKPVSNIDLLSGLDLNPMDHTIATPPLQPKLAVTSSVDVIPSSSSSTMVPSVTPSLVPSPAPPAIVKDVPQPLTTIPIQQLTNPSLTTVVNDKSNAIDVDLKSWLTNVDRKSSLDNLSICSDLSSIDMNIDWDSVSNRDERKSSATAIDGGKSDALKVRSDTFDDPKILKWFHKEVERMEKIMETLNIKTLNGTTHLDNKWKEIQDLLVKDEGKRTTNIAKLFPEKNRSFDSIPYDHARVLLPTCTDDYINAVYLKEVGPSCPAFILAQTPLMNTVKDFWYMIWSEKSTTIVSLHTPTEMLDPFFPQELNKETNYGDFSVTVQKVFDLSHCIERIVKVSMLGVDAILHISILQVKLWPKNSPANVLGVAHNIITTFKQQKQSLPNCGPIILNCISGSERSGLVALAVATIIATYSKKPILLNAVNVWYRICSQRKGALRDISTLELSMQIVLNNAHEILNKRGIMTSYQMKNAQATISSEKEEINDPFSDLDPLWKLKQK